MDRIVLHIAATSGKTKGVAISREVPMGLPLVWPGIANQSRGKDLGDRAGRGLSQIGSLGIIENQWW